MEDLDELGPLIQLSDTNDSNNKTKKVIFIYSLGS